MELIEDLYCLVYSKGLVVSERMTLRYLKFIESFKDADYGNKREYHHILPKVYFPEFDRSTWNIVNVDVRVHYVAHMILAKAVKGKMVQAFQLMGRVQKHKSAAYAMFKNDRPRATEQVRRAIAETVTKLWEDSEYRERQSIAHRGFVSSEQTRRKISEANKGKKKPEGFRVGTTLSVETRAKLSAARVGRFIWAKRPVTVYRGDNTPYLSIIGNISSEMRKLGLPSSLYKTLKGKRLFEGLRKCDISKLQNLGYYDKYVGWYIEYAK